MRHFRTAPLVLVAAAVAALFYVDTLAPGVGAGDSGELILAAASLGVPHPPGYPVWTLTARLAAAIPVGELPARVNALSALFAALAVGLFHLLARRAGLRAFPAVIATALFGAATVVWRSAVEAEIYSLATAWFLLLVWTSLRARRSVAAAGQAEALYFFLAGLAPLVHQSLLFPAIFLGAWILGHDHIVEIGRRRRAATVRRLAGAAGWALVGSSLLLVVALRGGAPGAFSFTSEGGILSALDGLVRRGYGALRQNPLRVDLLVAQAGGIAIVVATSIGVVASLLAAVGAFLGGRERAALRVIGLASLTVPLALVALIGFAPDAEHLAQIAPFLTPVIASTALLAGSGVTGLFRLAGPRRGFVLSVAMVLVTTGIVSTRYVACDRSGFQLPDRYARDLIGGLPDRATLILEGDNETFLAAYATRLEGVRPDVTLIHRRGYVFGDPYRLAGEPRARWTEIARVADLERITRGTGPVYYVNPPEDLAASGVGFEQEGLIYRAIPPGSRRAWTRPVLPGPRLPGSRRDPAAPAAWAPPMGWPTSSDLLPGGPRRYDYVTRKLAVAYSDAAARSLWDAGRHDEAFAWFQDAARVGFDFPAAHLNLATAAASTRRPELALDALLRARALAPLDPEPAARLAALLGAAGRHQDAALWFERAYELDPNPALASDAARAWKLAGDADRARHWRGVTG